LRPARDEGHAVLWVAEAHLTLAPLTNFDIGALCSAAVALIALRLRALTAGGALAAFAVGTATYSSLGPAGAAVLLAFFLTSVALSRFGRTRKRGFVDIGKTGARDAAQVVANGGVATICALLALGGDPRYAIAFAGAFAAANADTWGTEIGMLAAQCPRSILTLRPIATGLSGGITLIGTFAEIAGAALIAATSSAVGIGGFWAVTAGGIAGALVDSLLGASLQSLRWCPHCRRACETEPHACGANTTVVRGIAWLGNDSVNALATATGAAVAFALARH
jgi:uncharacterized protein (TIGR00297 family)